MDRGKDEAAGLAAARARDRDYIAVLEDYWPGLCLDGCGTNIFFG